MSLEFYTAATRIVADLEDALEELRDNALFSTKQATAQQVNAAFEARLALTKAIQWLKEIPEE